MNILYLVHQFYPMHYTGTEKFILLKAQMMQRMGHQVKVLTYSFYEEDFYDIQTNGTWIKEFVFKGVPVLAIRYKGPPADNLNSALRNEKIEPVARQLLAQIQPDLIHIGHPMRLGEFIRAAREMEIPYLFTLTDFWLMCPKGILVNSANALCAGPNGGNTCLGSCPDMNNSLIRDRLTEARGILEGADELISPSAFLAHFFMNEFPSISVSVINHGMSYQTIQRHKRTYQPGDPITFVYGGSLMRHKGVHVLIEAFNHIDSSNVTLKIFGSGPEDYTYKLKKLAQGNPKIHFEGVFSEEQIGDVMKQADVTVVPSLWYENYPLILHESLACNVPVITSNIGGMSERIKYGFNGYTFRLGDVNDLTKRIAEIVTNPEVLNTLKTNISRTLIPTTEQEACAYETLYRKILAERIGRSSVEIA